MNPASILVVEDEAIVAADLSKQLEELGYRVVGTAGSMNEAVAHARATRPSLVLMDVMLQGEGDGIEAARQIRRGLEIPVIFLTAFSDSNTVRRAAETAPYGYLTKPFQPRELRAAVEVALVKAGMERQLRESERWFAATLNCVGDAVIATDTDARISFLNPVAEALTGWTLAEARGRGIEEVLALGNGNGGGQVENPVLVALREDRVVGIEHGTRLIARDGRQVPVDDSAAPIRDEQGQALGAVVMLRDVSERQRREQQLRDSEGRFRNAFEFAPAGMALVSMSGQFLRVNSSFCQLLGRTEEELRVMPYGALTYPGDRETEQLHLQELLTGQTPAAQFERRYVHSDGRVLWTLTNVSLLQEAAQPVCYLYQVYDLTARKESEYKLARLAYSDPLTGLANRVRLRDELERLMTLAHRHKQQLAVVFIDLDRFKQVNDSLGHEAGDELLRTVADRLKRTLREIDCIARFGGDEFVLVLPETRNVNNMAMVAEKVRTAIAQPMMLGGHEIVVTPSLGISVYPDDGTDSRTLFRSADNALYASKARGRNTVSFFRPELAQTAQQHLELESALRQAITRQELFLEYQPIVNLLSGAILACEALVRWQRSGNTVSPAAFIPIAEETGLILPLGNWVLREACRAAAAWSTPLTVHVNCSARQFVDLGLINAVTSALEQSGLAPERLCLELTESVLLQQSEQHVNVIGRVKELGIKLSIDDYGTGYSSLAYLKHFAPQSLKVDRLFIKDLDTDTNSAAIVAATVAMAHRLGVEVVAEGVETDAQLARLRAFGCDYAQGFLFSRPVGAAIAAEQIRAGRLP